MHRGKVHDSGGDACFKSTGLVEVFNKSADTDENLHVPRIRTFIPFVQKSDKMSLKRGTSVDFEIESVTAKTKKGKIFEFLVATEVRPPDHKGRHGIYYKKGVWALALGAIVFYVLEYLINTGLLTKIAIWNFDFEQEFVSTRGFLLVAFLSLFHSLLLGWIIFWWEGSRHWRGGGITGLKVGSVVGIIIGLFAVQMGCLATCAGILFYGVTYAAKYGAVGSIQGWVFRGEKSGNLTKGSRFECKDPGSHGMNHGSGIENSPEHTHD